MFLFCLLGGGGGALNILLVLRGGQRKNIITVEFPLSLPCTINNEQSLKYEQEQKPAIHDPDTNQLCAWFPQKHLEWE
jgi:hypothetical protein